MAARARRAERRADALSKDRIVEAAIEILDSEGESALTFRALTARLGTGAGAIYWHVADKNALLVAATDAVVDRVMAEVRRDADPRVAIRDAALRVFDAIDVHPWVGAQLLRAPWQVAMVQLFEAIGGPLDALGVPERNQFDAASALVNYILGVAGQNAANARTNTGGLSRADFLAATAARWTERDPAEYPFAHRIAAQLRDHDDREQFLAGIDLILAGLGSVHAPRADLVKESAGAVDYSAEPGEEGA